MLVAILIHLWLYVEVWLEFHFFLNIFGHCVLEDVVILVYAVIILLFVTWESAAIFLRDHRFRGLPGSSPHCTQGCFTPRFSNTAFHTACHQLTGVSLGTRLEGRSGLRATRAGPLRRTPWQTTATCAVPVVRFSGYRPVVIPTLRPLPIQCSVSQYSVASHGKPHCH